MSPDVPWKGSEFDRVRHDATCGSVRPSERAPKNRNATGSDTAVSIARQQHPGLRVEPQRFGTPECARLSHTSSQRPKGYDMRAPSLRYGNGSIGAAIGDDKDADILVPERSDRTCDPRLLIPGGNDCDRRRACHAAAIGAAFVGISTSIR